MLCIYLSTYFLSKEIVKISSKLQGKIFFQGNYFFGQDFFGMSGCKKNTNQK